MSQLEEEYYLIHKHLDHHSLLKKFREVIAQLKRLGAIPVDQELAKELKAEKKALEKLAIEKRLSEEILEITDKKQYLKNKFQSNIAIGIAKIAVGLLLIMLCIGIALDIVFLIYGLGFTGIGIIVYGSLDIYTAYQLYRK